MTEHGRTVLCEAYSALVVVALCERGTGDVGNAREYARRSRALVQEFGFAQPFNGRRTAPNAITQEAAC